MPPKFPDTQSFFSSPPTRPSANASRSSVLQLPAQSPPLTAATELGDGFTPHEQYKVLQPSALSWTPTQEYDEMSIGALELGPKHVTFSGRIVNFHHMGKQAKSPLAAKGCLRLMVADNTGALTIRLWYADTHYKVHLGQLVKVWTVHISLGTQSSLAPTAAPLFTSIFPERERSCHIEFYDHAVSEAVHKRPYGCSDLKSLPGIMTIKSFTDGGHEVDECKLLVCVKSIGCRKKFTTKAGYSSELTSVGIFDDTGEAVLTLCGAVCNSTSYWKPSYTVLLVSKPGWKLERTTKLSLNANTRIDVDPNTDEAHWLRSLAQRLARRDHVNPPFPGAAFDVEAAETAAVQILYTLADIDDFARSNPKERCVGYISVLLTELNLVLNYKRNMLMSTECCGTPIYANALTAPCTQCNTHVPLRINPKILGPILDETGELSTGKLVFSDAAWTQLLGRTPEQFLRDDVEVLRFMEQRMLFLRVSMGFAWGFDREGMRSGEEKVGIKAWERKRKRLDVFRDVGRGKENLDPRVGGKEKEKTVVGTKDAEAVVDANKADVDGATAEVGRLCIWCVKA